MLRELLVERIARSLDRRKNPARREGMRKNERGRGGGYGSGDGGDGGSGRGGRQVGERADRRMIEGTLSRHAIEFQFRARRRQWTPRGRCDL